GYIPGIGTAPEMTKALFDELEVGALASRVFDVQGDAFVVRLTKREEPDMAKFQTEKARLANEIRDRKAFEAVTAFQSRRCSEALQAGAISFNPSLVSYGDLEPTAQTPQYVPCMTLR